MFGRKNKAKAEKAAAAHPTKATSDCGAKATNAKSTKASDMTSGGRSTKSCSNKAVESKKSCCKIETKNSTNKACGTKSCS